MRIFTTIGKKKKVNARSLLGNIWLVELWGLGNEGHGSKRTSKFLTIVTTWVVLPFTKPGNSKIRNGKSLSSFLGMLWWRYLRSILPKTEQQEGSWLSDTSSSCLVPVSPGGCCTSKLPLHVSEKKAAWRKGCRRTGEKSFPRKLSAYVSLVVWVSMALLATREYGKVILLGTLPLWNKTGILFMRKKLEWISGRKISGSAR